MYKNVFTVYGCNTVRVADFNIVDRRASELHAFKKNVTLGFWNSGQNLPRLEKNKREILPSGFPVRYVNAEIAQCIWRFYCRIPRF